MSSILSEISSKLSISALRDKLKDVYHDVNDKVLKVKDVLSEKTDENLTEKSAEEKKPNEKNEGYEEPAPPTTTKDKIISFLNKLKDYFLIFATFLLKIFFYVGLASLVANDMIIYSPVIRAFFFVFTFIVTYLFTPYAFFLACYYALRKGYDYYHDKLSSEVVKPPKSFPMIFAILPITTYYPDSPFVRFLLWAFMYQKTDNVERMEKENKRLDVIMSEYWNNLNNSFTYLDKIKSTEPFSRLYDLNKEHLTVKYMHPIKRPEIGGESLPAVIKNNEEPVANLHPMQAAPNKNVNKPDLYTMRPAGEAEKVTMIVPPTI